jgi:hypothetical protein
VVSFVPSVLVMDEKSAVESDEGTTILFVENTGQIAAQAP